MCSGRVDCIWRKEIQLLCEWIAIWSHQGACKQDSWDCKDWRHAMAIFNRGYVWHWITSLNLKGTHLLNIFSLWNGLEGGCWIWRAGKWIGVPFQNMYADYYHWLEFKNGSQEPSWSKLVAIDSQCFSWWPVVQWVCECSWWFTIPYE